MNGRVITIILTFTIACLLAFIGGRKSMEHEFTERVDTLYIQTEKVVKEPVLVQSEVVGLIPVPRFLFSEIRDTVYLERERKTYEDSTYHVVVSGYAVTLEELTIRSHDMVVTRTVETPFRHHALFIEANGTAPIGGTPSATLTGGYAYRWKSGLSVQVGGGYDFLEGTGVVTTRVRWDIGLK